MKKIFLSIVLCFSMLLFFDNASAQRDWRNTDKDRNVAAEIDSITKGGYTLIWINKDPDFNQDIKKRLMDTYFITYPQLAKDFNRATLKSVTFVIDPEYKGVAATSGGVIRYNPEWFVKNPSDIDVVTHEVMHVIQSYPHRAGPGWLTEGVADYVRFKYGVANEEANWSLTEFNEKQSYENSYRITARFLHWVVTHHDKKFVKKLDHTLREGKYDEDFWVKRTGSTVDELWEEYAKNPVI